MATKAANSVSAKHLAAEIAEKHGLSKKQSEEIMNDISAGMLKNLKEGNAIRWSGVGTFQVRQREARMGRNPATGEQMQIKASKKVAFRAAKELREAV